MTIYKAAVETILQNSGKNKTKVEAAETGLSGEKVASESNECIGIDSIKI